MFRLLGFLIGSAASVLTILLIIGIPEFHLSNPQLDKRRFNEAVEKLREKKQDVQQIAQQLIEDSPGGVDAPPVADSPDPHLSSQNVSLDVPDIAGGSALETVVPAIHQPPQWHSFWSPFRSELAARGFVSQLEKVTGLDYRVMKVNAGVYQVAFSYLDDTQRSSYLSQISAATGLEFPGT
jgi:hypothetical protein